MRDPSFDLLPQVLDRVVVWRVGRQLVDNETFFMLLKERTSSFAGMITSAILDQEDFARDLRKQIQ